MSDESCVNCGRDVHVDDEFDCYRCTECGEPLCGNACADSHEAMCDGPDDEGDDPLEEDEETKQARMEWQQKWDDWERQRGQQANKSARE